MSLDLTSVYAKLDRAEEHFKAVDSEIQRWINSGKDSFSIERGAHDTRVGVAIQFRDPQPDFLRWTLIIADCINNLRTSLDHLVYWIAKYEQGENSPGDIEKLSFIIVDTPEKFRNRENRKRLRGLSGEVIDAIECVQPYRRTHPSLPPLLGILREFSNADKHRLLQLAGAGISMFSGEVLGDASKGQKIVYILPEPIQNNNIICVVESTEPDPYLAFKSASFGIEVALWHGMRSGDTDPMHARTGYSYLLTALIGEVRFVVETIKDAVS